MPRQSKAVKARHAAAVKGWDTRRAKAEQAESRNASRSAKLKKYWKEVFILRQKHPKSSLKRIRLDWRQQREKRQKETLPSQPAQVQGEAAPGVVYGFPGTVVVSSIEDWLDLYDEGEDYFIEEWEATANYEKI